MKEGHLPERCSGARAVLKRPTGERSFWMRSASCPWKPDTLLRVIQETRI